MDLAARITAIENVEAIKALKYRYWRACDGKDPEGFRDCFIAKGARIDYGRMGAFDDVAPMVDIFAKVALYTVDGKHVIFDMHHGMHPDITLTGEATATGRWTLRFRQVNLLMQTETIANIEYDDDYVIEDGEWKMSRSVSTETWSMTRPLDPAATVTEPD
ncbi:nuclear transport factor 2 family protein [Gordonia sp. (in: high G+C Gram-positive bacteria)]|uniref:nuclear transport factor 2 family protein n=1 Tax=Gordonia sp. (in: high G+C Gram-positive bacteria) TaxID=84139 RepID=UPI003C74E5BB